MTERHVGKKRRKEVREAVNMKHEIAKDLRVIVGAIVVAFLVIGASTFMTVTGMFGDNAIVQSVPLAIVFLGVMLMSFRINGFWALRSRYKEHCERYNISKEDMRALEEGKL